MANVQVLALGRALVQGARGARGGAASKDSVWGVALIDGRLVKFHGRTGGVLRFRTEPLKAQAAALELFQRKLTKPFKHNGEDVVYTDAIAEAESLIAGGVQGLATQFGRARKAKKLDTRPTLTASQREALGDARTFSGAKRATLAQAAA